MLNLSRKYYCMVLLLVCIVAFTTATNDNEKDKDKPAWAKKKITDYSEADMERLLDQWNVSACKFFPILANMILT